MSAAFAPPFSLRSSLHYSLTPSPSRSLSRRPRARTSPLRYASPLLVSMCASSPPSDEPPLFVESGSRPLLALDDVSLTAPLSDEEREAVLRALPGPVARFLIRRADEALAPPDASDTPGMPRPNAGMRAASAAALRGERARKWLGVPTGMDDEDAWYREYIREDMDDQMDEFGRPVAVAATPAGVAEDGDLGEEYASGPRLPDGPGGGVALFAGSPSDEKEQGQQVWYGVLALVMALVALKIILAFVQFFVSFTFSFLAIFALSAGIFVFFFLVRF